MRFKESVATLSRDALRRELSRSAVTGISIPIPIPIPITILFPLPSGQEEHHLTEQPAHGRI
jgi:uncharacterized membrane protein